jgi:hypothetical protein
MRLSIHCFRFSKLLLNLENISTLVLDFLRCKTTTATTQILHLLSLTNAYRLQ